MRRISVPTFLYIYKTMCVCLIFFFLSFFLFRRYLFHRRLFCSFYTNLDWRRRRLLSERHLKRRYFNAPVYEKQATKKVVALRPYFCIHMRIFYECGISFSSAIHTLRAYNANHIEKRRLFNQACSDTSMNFIVLCAVYFLCYYRDMHRLWWFVVVFVLFIDLC